MAVIPKMGMGLGVVLLRGPVVHFLGHSVTMMYGKNLEQLFYWEHGRVGHTVDRRLRNRKTGIAHPLQQPTLPLVGPVEVTVFFHHLIIQFCTSENIFQYLSWYRFNIRLSEGGQNAMHTILHQNKRLKSQGLQCASHLNQHAGVWCQGQLHEGVGADLR